MGFFDKKVTCGACNKKIGFNRYKIKKSNTWICPQCLKKAGGLSKVNLSIATIEDIKNLINPKVYTKKYICEHIIEFNSAGVTFENRQDTLKELSKLSIITDVTFEVVEYEGEPAVKLYANIKEVGWVPKKWINVFLKHKDWNYRIKQANIYKVYGKNGKFNCYGFFLSFAFELPSL